MTVLFSQLFDLTTAALTNPLFREFAGSFVVTPLVRER
jgi:hypothetical protein